MISSRISHIFYRQVYESFGIVGQRLISNPEPSFLPLSVTFRTSSGRRKGSEQEIGTAITLDSYNRPQDGAKELDDSVAEPFLVQLVRGKIAVSVTNVNGHLVMMRTVSDVGRMCTLSKLTLHTTTLVTFSEFNHRHSGGSFHFRPVSSRAWANHEQDRHCAMLIRAHPSVLYVDK